ncbi:hypothetical protein AURDEDRAFT_166271 [Auricularia subglabra TFB-10046 SS5]|nr:hypothetical protein AURDEDRAFT_166271 [Auricularia subglabra TFB-10046 SS5]
MPAGRPSSSASLRPARPVCRRRRPHAPSSASLGSALPLAEPGAISLASTLPASPTTSKKDDNLLPAVCARCVVRALPARRHRLLHTPCPAARAPRSFASALRNAPIVPRPPLKSVELGNAQTAAPKDDRRVVLTCLAISSASPGFHEHRPHAEEARVQPRRAVLVPSPASAAPVVSHPVSPAALPSTTAQLAQAHLDLGRSSFLATNRPRAHVLAERARRRAARAAWSARQDRALEARKRAHAIVAAKALDAPPPAPRRHRSLRKRTGALSRDSLTRQSSYGEILPSLPAKTRGMWTKTTRLAL